MALPTPFEIWIQTNTGFWYKAKSLTNAADGRDYAQYNCSTSGGRIKRIEMRLWGKEPGEALFDLDWVGHQPMPNE